MIILATTFIFSGAANAAEYWGKVTGLFVNNEYVQIALDNGIPNSDPPACIPVNGLWDFRYDDTTNVAAKKWFSMLLEARTTGKSITVGYNPNQNAICDIWYVYFHGG